MPCIVGIFTVRFAALPVNEGANFNGLFLVGDRALISQRKPARRDFASIHVPGYQGVVQAQTISSHAYSGGA
jgi:hypothetical protein